MVQLSSAAMEDPMIDADLAVTIDATRPTGEGLASVAGSSGPRLNYAVIVKRVDEQTRAKTSINELLRE
jgi:tetrahydrodipicolinate N-succinyltransferase